MPKSKSPKTPAAPILDTDAIKRFREELKLTQGQAAVAAGFTSRQWWNEIEAGRQVNISMITLAAISKALKCDPQQLLISPQPRRTALAGH